MDLEKRRAEGKTCWGPEGYIFEEDLPCLPDADESFCCYPGHSCMSNGMCRFPDNHMPGQMAYIRGTCTDKRWTNSNCPPYCVDDFHMVDCFDGFFCCTLNSKDAAVGECCSRGPLFSAQEGTTLTVIGGPNYATSAARAKPTTSSFTVTSRLGETMRTIGADIPDATVGADIPDATGDSSASSSAAASGNGNSDRNRAIALGAGIGGGILGAAVLAGLVVVFLKLRKKASYPS